MNADRFLDALCNQKLLNKSASHRVSIASKQTDTPVEKTILELGLLSEATLYEELAKFLRLSFISPSDVDPALSATLDLSHEFLVRMMIVPIRETDEGLVFATSDPRSINAIESIGFKLDTPISLGIAAPTTIKSALETSRKSSDAVHSEGDEASDQDLEKLSVLANNGPTISQVNDLIARAANEGASDIHLEATDDALRVRFRIDGTLQEKRSIPGSDKASVVSRLKIMANLNISERRRPQDGRAEVSVQGRRIDIRLSTLPTQFGESVVLRLLDRERVRLEWDYLGFEDTAAKKIRRLISQPNGIFLVAGPTGSGKTTTLYTALSTLNSNDRKIITVEDPIEYSMPGINQVQVQSNLGLGFPEALRAILRQDPDVIMIGEIRDKETAEIAVRAALVGRLVISTIHTNDSISALTRLQDLGIPSFLLSATLRGVLSQRLLRKSCHSCEGRGCGECKDTGFKGRQILSEILEVTPSLSQLISEDSELDVIVRASKAEGFETMRQVSEELIRQHKTTAAEVIRTLGAF